MWVGVCGGSLCVCGGECAACGCGCVCAACGVCVYVCVVVTHKHTNTVQTSQISYNETTPPNITTTVPNLSDEYQPFSS